MHPERLTLHNGAGVSWTCEPLVGESTLASVAPAFFAMLLSERSAWEGMGYPPQAFASPAYVEHRLATVLAGPCNYALFQGDSMIGLCGIKGSAFLESAAPVVEAGYCLATSATGKGIISITLAEVLSRAFAAAPALQSVEFVCWDSNVKSHAVAERAGGVVVRREPPASPGQHALVVYAVARPAVVAAAVMTDGAAAVA